MFTRQHYQAIAYALSKDANLQESTINLFCELFHNDNARFSDKKFKEYINIWRKDKKLYLLDDYVCNLSGKKEK